MLDHSPAAYYKHQKASILAGHHRNPLVGDAGVIALFTARNLLALQRLDLGFTRVTDESLQILIDSPFCSQPKELGLKGVNCSKNIISRLQTKIESEEWDDE